MSRDFSSFALLMQKLIARDRRRADHDRPQPLGRSFERLEQRMLLTTATWNSVTNELDIVGDSYGNDSIVVSKDGSGNVTVTDGIIPVSITNGPVSAGAVDAIDVDTNGGGADFVDLSAVKTANGFSADLNDNVTITGTAYGDTIIGSAFDDSIFGGEGNDFLTGNEGDDYLQGDAGQDTFLFSGTGGLGTDTLTGTVNNDEDTLDFSGFSYMGSAGVTVDIGNYSTTQMLNSGLSLYLNHGSYQTAFKQVIGTPNADSITGDSNNDLLRGQGGADTVNGADGADSIYGEEGSDSLIGGAGADLVRGGDSAGNETSGNDTISGGIGLDSLYGDAGNDSIFGDDDNDLIYCGAGNDAAYGGNGDDTIYGEAGDDTIVGQSGTDVLDGGSGSNTVIQDN